MYAALAVVKTYEAAHEWGKDDELLYCPSGVAELLEHFRENGWVVVPNVLSPAEVQTYRASLDAPAAWQPVTL